MKLIIILVILFLLYIRNYKNIQNKSKESNKKEGYIDCNKKSNEDFFYKGTNISDHLNEINTKKQIENEFVPDELIDYNVSKFNNNNLIHQMGSKTSNKVIEGEKINNLLAYNQYILKKSFNKNNKVLIDNANMYNCSFYNSINKSPEKKITELVLLGRYKNNKLHLNWNILKNNNIKTINLIYREKEDNNYNKIEIPYPKVKNNGFYSIGKVKVYNYNDSLKYNFFFKEIKRYEVYLELIFNDGNIITSNLF